MHRRLEYARLEGERVVLRPVAASDAARAFELIAGRQEILRWLLWDGPVTAAELEERYGTWRMDGDVGPEPAALGARASDYQFAICDRSDGAFVGALSVRFRGHPDEGDLGYWLGTEYWNRGFATEAVRLADRLAFHHLGASALCACVFAGNEASRRVLERNGWVHEHTSPAKIAKRGELLDEWYLVLTRFDWESCDGRYVPRAEEVRGLREREPTQSERTTDGGESA